jgi:hypothetical protein
MILKRVIMLLLDQARRPVRTLNALTPLSDILDRPFDEVTRLLENRSQQYHEVFYPLIGEFNLTSLVSYYLRDDDF